MSGTSGSLFVIAAPSGAGKSTLVKRLIERIDGLQFSVSWTTRAPRAGERDGVDYIFTDDDTFRDRARQGAFLEWAEVHGDLYGTDRDAVRRVLAEGDDVLLDIDVQGAAQVVSSGVPAELIFIMPPSFEDLETRLRGRGTESESSVRRRLGNAAREIREFASFGFVVINDDLDAAADDLVAIVRASRARLDRRAGTARRIVATFPPPGQDGAG